MAFTTGTTSISSEINVTPLIDVLLVLLIIFMVIVPVMPHGLPAAVPQPSHRATTQAPPEQPLVLKIDAAEEGPRYAVNGHMVRPAAFGGYMAALLSTRADKDVFVQAASELDLEAVTQAMSALHAAGAGRIAILTKTDVAAMSQ